MSWDQRIPSDKLLERQLEHAHGYIHDLHPGVRVHPRSSRPGTQAEAKIMTGARSESKRHVSGSKRHGSEPEPKTSRQSKVAQALAATDLQRPVYNPKDCTITRYDRNNDLLLTKQMVEDQLFRNGAFTGQFWNQRGRPLSEP